MESKASRSRSRGRARADTFLTPTTSSAVLMDALQGKFDVILIDDSPKKAQSQPQQSPLSKPVSKAQSEPSLLEDLLDWNNPLHRGFMEDNIKVDMSAAVDYDFAEVSQRPIPSDSQMFDQLD